MIRKFALLNLYLLASMGCNQDPTTDSEENDWTIPTASEDVLIGRLAPYLINQDEDTNQHNHLINHIYDQNWDMQYHPPGIFGAIIATGTGIHPKWGDRVLVHYNGYTLDGIPFDSSFKKGKPFRFYIGNVIAGWNAALPLLDVGGRGVFIIPSDLAYGADGFKSLVKPNQHLLFEIELLQIEESEPN